MQFILPWPWGQNNNFIKISHNVEDFDKSVHIVLFQRRIFFINMRKSSRKPGEPHCRDCNTVTHQVRFSKPLGHGQCQKLPTHSIKKPGRRFLCTGGHEWGSKRRKTKSMPVKVTNSKSPDPFCFNEKMVIDHTTKQMDETDTESIASSITSNEMDADSDDEKEKFGFVIAPEDEDWFPSENSDEGGDINNNSIINADWSMGDVEYGRWINQFDDADESKKATLQSVTEEMPITVSRRAPDKEARPITLKSKAKLLKD